MPHPQTIRRLWFKPALPHGKGLPKGSPFPWRRDRDLNPGRHHCLTRFRIVRVQPLRHLCIDGRRAPEMQTSFYRKSAKKATDFALLREIFCFRDGTPFLASLLAAPEMRFGGQGESAFLTPPRECLPARGAVIDHKRYICIISSKLLSNKSIIIC